MFQCAAAADLANFAASAEKPADLILFRTFHSKFSRAVDSSIPSESDFKDGLLPVSSSLPVIGEMGPITWL